MEDTASILPELPEIGSDEPAAKLPKRKSPARKPRKTAVIIPDVSSSVRPAFVPRKPAPSLDSPPGAVHLRWYWKIAATLSALSVVVLVFVMYLIFSRVTITVVPRHDPATASARVNIGNPDAVAGAVRGVYKRASATDTRTMPISGSGSTKEGVATGMVTLFNTTAAAQSLVATTRLLTPGGVLFRIKSAVTIPAKGRAEATVYADKPGASGNIGPSKFTIPGLRPSLQTDIYAASTVPMTGGIRNTKVVSQEDITAAYELVIQALTAEAAAKLRALAGDAAALGGEVITSKVTKRETAAAAGTEASEVAVTIGVTVEAVWYDKSALEAAVRAAVSENIPAGQELVAFDPAAIAVEVVSGDADAGTAVVSASGKGESTFSASSPVFDKALLTGLTKARVLEYFRTIPGVDSVTVKFRPFWVRRVPGAKDHIEIIISQ